MRTGRAFTRSAGSGCHWLVFGVLDQEQIGVRGLLGREINWQIRSLSDSLPQPILVCTFGFAGSAPFQGTKKDWPRKNVR